MLEVSASTGAFLFATCQIGAEEALKAEVAREHPELRFAYSRPGFLTFKQSEGSLPAEFRLRSAFARAHGISLARIKGDEPEAMAAAVWQALARRGVRRLHVWPRDEAPAGYRGYEPQITEAALAVRKRILAACPTPDALLRGAEDPFAPARLGERVADCVLVGPEEWWVGYHAAVDVASRHPGGMMRLVLPADAVSRAWLKMEEALRWAELPIPAAARIAEIGSAPGGASQALLARGYQVLGVDPAAMDPRVVAEANFVHLRARANQVKRREYRKIRWLAADMNVAPNFTLDVVESIVQHPEVNVRGMLLTLKLTEWSLADKLPDYLERVRAWGYNEVAARQLQHNRQEVCVRALQHPFRRKPPVRK